MRPALSPAALLANRIVPGSRIAMLLVTPVVVLHWLLLVNLSIPPLWGSQWFDFPHWYSCADENYSVVRRGHGVVANSKARMEDL